MEWFKQSFHCVLGDFERFPPSEETKFGGGKKRKTPLLYVFCSALGRVSPPPHIIGKSGSPLAMLLLMPALSKRVR